ncbi:MAG: UbiA family prenyltransferase [Chitinispirillaceae bacterium]|nr:UbiA family prenyltransferase [Chitinispirillaceae bacterium]
MRLTHTAFTATFPTFFLGLAASFQITALYVYHGHKPDWLLTVLCFVITTGTYLLNRIFDKEDKINNVSRWKFFNSSSRKSVSWILLSFIALTGPVFLLMALKQFQLALLFGIISAIGLIYTVKILPYYKNGIVYWTNLKSIPVGKNIIVCTIWGGGAIAISSVFLNINPFRSDLLMLFIAFFTGSCNSNIGSDARDINGDTMCEIKTLSSLIGFKNTFYLLSGINLTGLITVLTLYNFGIGTYSLALCSSICIIWAELSIIPQFTIPQHLGKITSEILADSQHLLCAPILIVCTVL